ncbi:Fe-S cluster assembly protein SufD [Roseivirga sp.]|uniref:Fe-S cluster assembly protein SufD n=1 Tax=Roseivirga sp. TaxID=1964215 RepID=UPI003B51EF2E
MKKFAGQSIIDQLSERFEASKQQLTSNAAIADVRQKALNHLRENGLPHPKAEEYKFTNLTKALEKHINFALEAEGNMPTQEQVAQLRISGLDAYFLTFINGKFVAEFSDEIKEDGVSFSTLSEAIEQGNDLAEKHFDKLSKSTEDAFVAMNSVLASEGAVIEVKANAVIQKPIYIQCINTRSSDVHTKNLIDIGQNAQVTILEKVDTLQAEPGFSNVVNEISVAAGANAKYYKIENDTPTSYHISNVHVTQGKDSKFTANTVALDGAMVRNNLDIKLEAEGCEAYMNGLYLLNGKTHVDNHTTVDHTKPNAYSNELYKGIMDDQSRGVFNGKIFVRQDAQKTNAFQSNKNILLTDNATVNTKPQLEIWADDVKCSHGCTTGQLDKDALFYLMARGIKKDSAMAMLLHAFASDVIENLELEPVQAYVEAIITARLEK